MSRIKSIDAITVFDSRGYPTIECRVHLTSGNTGTAIVPSGASTGSHEALELRDGDLKTFGGKSVNRAIGHIIDIIQPALLGFQVDQQEKLDQTMIELDGTPNKSRLGANAILAVSMAYAHASASFKQSPLYQSLGNRDSYIIPLPEIQIFGGGAHSAQSIDIQDFMVIGIGAKSLMECYQMTFDIYQQAGKILKKKGLLAGVADEGGYWPLFNTNEEVLMTLTEAIERSGYRPGIDIAISLDIAASEFYENNKYHLRLEGRKLSADEFCKVVESWIENYPICSLEDPFAEMDFEAWQLFADRWKDKIQIIGDDLFTTNPVKLQHGIENSLANSVLIKLNQIGTVSETLKCIEMAQDAGWRPVVSARSGETEDRFIAHLAVATGAGQLKVGSFTRSERMAKWNELLRIEHALKDKASFANSEINFPWQIS
ncbi:MAG: phosphopyruvate hydratase [Saprospiraceae bacterium]|nr:phosphopyruvate hydratase [Saprospiraceae bacterium]